MKKVLLMIVFCGAIAFTSCIKKSDYTCACTYTSTLNGVVQDTDVETYQYNDEKEENAQILCDANESSISLNLGGSSSNRTNVCTLSEK